MNHLNRRFATALSFVAILVASLSACGGPSFEAQKTSCLAAIDAVIDTAITNGYSGHALSVDSDFDKLRADKNCKAVYTKDEAAYHALANKAMSARASDLLQAALVSEFAK